MDASVEAMLRNFQVIAASSFVAHSFNALLSEGKY